MFHLRHSPALREFLVDLDWFPFSGLTMLSFKSETRAEVEADLCRLIDQPGVDEPKLERRRDLLRLYRSEPDPAPIELTAYGMENGADGGGGPPAQATCSIMSRKPG